MPKRRVRLALATVFGLVGAIATCRKASRFRLLRVSGQSMAPTLMDGDLLVMDRWAFQSGAPARGGLVVLRDPRQETRRVVKRIIGVPGDNVVVRDGHVQLNNILLDEPTIMGWPDARTAGEGDWSVGEDVYFVMGDNRADSTDSRTFGPVFRGALVGRAVWRLRLPFSWRRLM